MFINLEMVRLQAMKMNASGAYILFSLMIYFEASAVNIYVMNNSVVTIKCDFLSTTHSLIWLGPQNLVAYTDGKQINRNIKKFRRIAVSGDHTEGRYDLVINNFTDVDEGLYKCNTLNNGKTQESTYFVRVKHKPILLTKKDAQRFYTEVGLPINITFKIESFENPTASWLSGTLQGKRSNWKLHTIARRLYLLSSTILPYSNEHFGTYKARIRNSVGMIDADIKLIEDNTSISIVPSSVICNTSSAISIACSLNEDSFRVWKRSWVHFRQGTFVRSIEGRTINNVSILQIDFCDFQDEGIYVCKWSGLRRQISAEVYVHVQSEPIVTRQLIQTNHSYVTLKVMFYSHEYPQKPTWYHNLNDELVEKDLVLSLINVDIEIQCYGKGIHEKGYQAALIINESAISKLTDFSCQLSNFFGKIESTFKASDIQENINSFEVQDSMLQLTTKYRPIRTTDIQKDSTSKEVRMVYLYAIISGGVVILLAILFTSSMIVVLRTYKQGYLHTKVGTRSQRNHDEEITDHVYDDIDSSGIEPISQEPYDEMITYSDSGSLSNDGMTSTMAITQQQSLYESMNDINKIEECELTNDSTV